MHIALLLGFAAFVSTSIGGLVALRKQDKLHLILGFSAGAVMGVALFDLMPEALDLAGKHYAGSTVTAVIAVGFFSYMFFNRVLSMHSHEHDEADTHHRRGALGAASLSIHSFLDGLGIGLAFKVSTAVGLVLAVAVLAHDFSDGINTVGFILRHEGKNLRAMKWLAADAIAPVLGVISTFFFTLNDVQLGLVLALFCGFFLYIGASDLLPESHHRHPKALTGIMNILGALVVYLAIHFAAF